MENEMQTVARHLETAPVNLKAIFTDLGIDYYERPLSSGESACIDRRRARYMRRGQFDRGRCASPLQRRA